MKRIYLSLGLACLLFLMGCAQEFKYTGEVRLDDGITFKCDKHIWIGSKFPSNIPVVSCRQTGVNVDNVDFDIPIRLVKEIIIRPVPKDK